MLLATTWMAITRNLVKITFLVLACIGSLAQARDYANYDERGLVPFEDIKEPSASVKQAVALQAAGNYKQAQKAFVEIIKTNKFEEQAILGAVESAKKLSTGPQLRKECEKLFRGGTNGDNFALNMIRILLVWDRSVESKGSDDIINWIIVAKGSNPKGFLVNFRYALLPNTQKVRRKMLDKICSENKRAHGLQFYRIFSYVQGDLGGGHIDPDTGKIVNDTDPENFLKPGRAIELLTPYLSKPQVPTWSAYLAAMAYFLKKDMVKAEHWRKQVQVAVATGNPHYKRWSNLLDGLWTTRK